MRFPLDVSISLVVLALPWLGWAGAPSAAKGSENAPVPTVTSPDQIEADWLRQELRRGHPQAAAKKVSPEDDARGGCDGIKTGRWGFHTAFEERPWWQVDLGRPAAIERVVLYNRCDATAGRTARIMILLSDDGRDFKTVYQHDGHTFFGQSDGKPLAVTLHGATGRYLRLQLPGKSYLHLDEVEVFAFGNRANIALGRPATQSSVSTWSVAHPERPAAGDEASVAIDAASAALAIHRARRLAADLRGRGVAVDGDVAQLEQLGRELVATAAADAGAYRRIYLAARGTARRLALRNPLLDFDAILFVKAAPTLFPHMSDQFYGWWSRPGGGVFVLDGFKGPQPRLRCLTADLPSGSFLRPELSYDGRKVLFAYCRWHAELADLRDKVTKAHLPEDAFYHVYEMNVDGSGRRRLTHGRYDDFDARYLPNGRIVFLSTRKGQFLQTTAENTCATTSADLPDSYVRCGGNDYRPVPVFTLHTMDGDGGRLEPLSAFENFEWTPAVAHDGRILYTRWDYIDRFNGHFFSLWSTIPDGSNAKLVYGNYTVRPQVKGEAVPIPGSSRLLFVGGAHHSILGGSLVLLDCTHGTEGDAPITRLTPEVPFPETESNVDSYYANPCPLSEEHYLVAWSDRRLPPHGRIDDLERNPVNALGLYLYDAFGNLNLIYRDPEISSSNPLPLRPRPLPAQYADHVAGDGGRPQQPAEGTMLLENVYQGLTGIARGRIKTIRVVGVPPKVQPQMNQPSLGISREDPGKFVLGTAPVEVDGSACFRVPAGVSLLFQALDAEGLAVQTMRSLTYVAPGQTASCVGCHESRGAAPPPAGYPLAARREPSRLSAGPEGTWPLRYDRLVQPVLDRACVSCHRPGSGDQQAARCDLTPARSYDSLLDFADKDLRRLALERDRSVAGDCTARQSRLWALVSDPRGHAGVHLDADGRQRLATWMDLYAQRLGHYSDQQEADLRQLREKLAPLVKP